MDQSLVEQVVSRVLAQLQSSSVGSVVEQSSSLCSPMAIQNVAVVELMGAVITAETLQETVQVGHPLRIGLRSVLTPSARDWLQTNRIAWSRMEPNAAASVNPASQQANRWRLIVQTLTPAVKSLSEGLSRQTDVWKIQAVGQFSEAATMATTTANHAEHDGVVVLSDHAEVIACLANRNKQVRAAVIADRKQLELAVQRLGVNVVCINPIGRSYVEMRNLLRDCTANKPSAPIGW